MNFSPVWGFFLYEFSNKSSPLVQILTPVFVKIPTSVLKLVLLEYIYIFYYK